MNIATKTEKIQIREWRLDDAIGPITALLHEAYAPLAAMGFRYVATHQDDATTLQRLTAGFPLVGELDGRVVATVTLYPPAKGEGKTWYYRPDVYKFGQFAVRPDLQRCGLGTRLVGMVEQMARDRSAVELALDTAEGATHLRRWYERLDYRVVEYVCHEDTNYRSVIMSKPLQTSA